MKADIKYFYLALLSEKFKDEHETYEIFSEYRGIWLYRVSVNWEWCEKEWSQVASIILPR